MNANRSGGIYVLIFGLLAAGLSGCEEKMPSLFPFSTPPSEEHGIITAHARWTRNLQELTEEGPGDHTDLSLCRVKRSARIWPSRSARSLTRSCAAGSFALWRHTTWSPAVLPTRC